MFNPRHFLRMARWAKKPPSAKRVRLFFGIILACLALYGIDRIFGWPDWLTIEGTPHGRINR